MPPALHKGAWAGADACRLMPEGASRNAGRGFRIEWSVSCWVQFPGNEGILLRINEAYEHEPILPYQGEESCPVGGCSKVGMQCVDVAQALTLTPTATVGAAIVTCQGSPRVDCETATDGAACLVTVTQRVCVTVPIRFGATVEPNDLTIACAGTADGAENCAG